MTEEEEFENIEAFERKYGKITHVATIEGKHYVFTATSTHIIR